MVRDNSYHGASHAPLSGFHTFEVELVHGDLASSILVIRSNNSRNQIKLVPN
jgi:hypothetical protein